MKLIYEKTAIYEAIRFIIVGIIATCLHYAVYYTLMKMKMNASLAFTIGYAVSFTGNFFMTSYFTFKSKASVKRGLGFSAAHLCNYLIQLALLNLFIGIGVSKSIAPLPTYAIAIPINFLMVRYVFKHKTK
ncbi:MAG: GtrA family protein [Bacteroidales bacterium]|nr:GtrA family protein [Bacteroidales bacterium]